jgi:hypothetical protein
MGLGFARCRKARKRGCLPGEKGPCWGEGISVNIGQYR